jgi:hypothetical protein
VYDLNLIRHKIVPERQKRMVFSVISLSALAYILTFLAVVFFSAANFRMIDAYASEIDKLEGDLSVLYPGTPTQEELSTIIRRMTPDLNEISGLVERRQEVTYLWEGIVGAVPDSIWLTSVRVVTPEPSEKPDKSEKGNGKDRGKQKAGSIVIQGVALAGKGRGGSDLIRDFSKALESSQDLNGRTSGAKFVEKDRRRMGSMDVIGFEITCALK